MEYECYSSYVAKLRVEKNWENKSPDLKIGNDHVLAEKIESMLIGEEVPGHWEMDCIESSKGDRSCLLTLIDRHNRESILFKLGRQTQEAVLRRINGLERELGSKEFK